jgi:hypothetical protein
MELRASNLPSKILDGFGDLPESPMLFFLFFVDVKERSYS